MWGTSAEQSAVYLQSAKKNIVTVFHSGKVAGLSGPGCFLNLSQMRTNENYGLLLCYLNSFES